MTAVVVLGEFRHAEMVPYLAVVRRDGEPRTVDVQTGPAGHPVRGVADPGELRAMAWLLLDHARWLDHGTTEPADDPQLTIYEALEAAR